MNRGCADCHHGVLLGGGSIEKFGVVKNYWTATGSDKADAGRFDVTQNEADRYKFRVPMLRNIAKTAPYFHDGSVAKLDEAVQIMADVQFGERLSDRDAAAIRSFFDALTGEIPSDFSPPADSCSQWLPPRSAQRSSPRWQAKGLQWISGRTGCRFIPATREIRRGRLPSAATSPRAARQFGSRDFVNCARS